MLILAFVLTVIVVGGGLAVITLRVSPAYKAECEKLAQAKKKTPAVMARRKRESLTRQVILVIVMYLLCSTGCLLFLAESYYH